MRTQTTTRANYNPYLMDLAVERTIEKRYPYLYDLARVGVERMSTRIRLDIAFEYAEIMTGKPASLEEAWNEMPNVSDKLIFEKYDTCPLI